MLSPDTCIPASAQAAQDEEEDEFKDRDEMGLMPKTENTKTEAEATKLYLKLLLGRLPVIGQVFAWATYFLMTLVADQKVSPRPILFDSLPSRDTHRTLHPDTHPSPPCCPLCPLWEGEGRPSGRLRTVDRLCHVGTDRRPSAMHDWRLT